MKTRLFFATLLTVMSVAVFAGNNTDVVYDSTSVFKVYYKGTTPAKVKISIFDANGEKIFSESIKNKDGFVRPYNMNMMEEGTYKFEINDGAGIEVYEFDYSLPKKDVSTVMGVSVRKLSDERFLFLLGNANNSEIVIKIENAKGETVYNTTEKVQSQFAQIFNLKKINSDTYTFKVYNNNQLIKSTSL